MCDSERANSKQDETCQGERTFSLSLLDLPIEVFLHICTFLDASSLVHGLSLVCKQFHQILNDDSIWKVRIHQICRPNANYPALPPDENDELFWKLSCVALERQASLWKNQVSLERLSLANVHYSTIDGVLLMHNGELCISGARDRTLVLWRLPNDESKCPKSVSVDLAHEGWIWDLTAIKDTIYSCSWDRTIKSWALTEAGLAHLTTYEMTVSGALLCVTSCPDLARFATGSFCKSVLVFDARSGDHPILRYQPHQRAVIRLAMSSNFILSASEDKTVSIWDQRAGRTMKNITLSKNSFPMSLCLKKDIVYVGDTTAKIHILDPKKDFEPVKCYKTEHLKGITGVHCSAGCLITSSLDKTVRISSPTDPPQPLTTLTCGYGEIASIDYLNEVLAVSGTDAIEIWRPKRKTECTL
ncbi:F-box/WD repeat-containing protein 9-like isoform X2 [Belonocnema kinseyi]|uniref:F-box/WD repeat-containing protein 9-like isoform X2 n=1 Tax=Belonocnema kinseyi TaxID=2817044 RepID=UPI00143DC7D8|nr:F-box/WD repeat-containing protein 9-like isoform X2 [Belonocnema kinseyi]